MINKIQMYSTVSIYLFWRGKKEIFIFFRPYASRAQLQYTFTAAAGPIFEC